MPCIGTCQAKRSVENPGLYGVIKELNKIGVTVNTEEQPIDTPNHDNKILLSLYLTMPEVENDKIAMRTAQGSLNLYSPRLKLKSLLD